MWEFPRCARWNLARARGPGRRSSWRPNEWAWIARDSSAARSRGRNCAERPGCGAGPDRRGQPLPGPARARGRLKWMQDARMNWPEASRARPGAGCGVELPVECDDDCDDACELPLEWNPPPPPKPPPPPAWPPHLRHAAQAQPKGRTAAQPPRECRLPFYFAMAGLGWRESFSHLKVQTEATVTCN